MAQSKPKRAKQDPAMLLEEELDLICDWEVCKQLFRNIDRFSEHVAQHVGQVDDDKGSITCMWEDCGSVTSGKKEMMRHIYCHAYHTKLKFHGAQCIEKRGLQECQLDSKSRNAVPQVTEPFICSWVDCKLEFDNIQEFVSHVHSHSTTKNVGEKTVKCLWGNCKSSFKKYDNLSDHLKSHSQAKCVACPTCGSVFANRTKFHDHCLRQVPPDG